MLLEKENIVKLWGVFLILGMVLVLLQIYLVVTQLRERKSIQDIEKKINM